MCTFVYVCTGVRACVHACMRVCVRAWVCGCMLTYTPIECGLVVGLSICKGCADIVAKVQTNRYTMILM